MCRSFNLCFDVCYVDGESKSQYGMYICTTPWSLSSVGYRLLIDEQAGASTYKKTMLLLKIANKYTFLKI